MSNYNAADNSAADFKNNGKFYRHIVATFPN